MSFDRRNPAQQESAPFGDGPPDVTQTIREFLVMLDAGMDDKSAREFLDSFKDRGTDYVEAVRLRLAILLGKLGRFSRQYPAKSGRDRG